MPPQIHTLTIPDALKGIIRAIQVHEDGSVAVHYVDAVSVGGVMADGRTFLAGPSHVGPYEIRVERVLMIEVNRKAKRLGRHIAPELEPGPQSFEFQRAIAAAAADQMRHLASASAPSIAVPRQPPALPPVQGYRDPRPATPASLDVPPALAAALDEEDGTVVRGRLLELDLPPTPAEFCDSCGASGGQHERGCRRCLECGAPDRDACEC